MTARDAVIAAAVAALRDAPGLADAGVFDSTPVRAGLPFVVVDEPVLTDWSTKSWQGREARLGVAVQDGGERPVRLRALADAADAALMALARAGGRDLGGGWTLANIVPLRARVVRSGERWVAAADYQLRLYRAAPTMEV